MITLTNCRARAGHICMKCNTYIRPKEKYIIITEAPNYGFKPLRYCKTCGKEKVERWML